MLTPIRHDRTLNVKPGNWARCFLSPNWWLAMGFQITSWTALWLFFLRDQPPWCAGAAYFCLATFVRATRRAQKIEDDLA